MKRVLLNDSNEWSPGGVDRKALARRYAVGARTVDHWHAQGIIQGVPHGRKVLFLVGDCDQRLHAQSRSPRST